MTPPPIDPYTYIGCYKDTDKRALSDYFGGLKTVSDCYNAAKAKGHKFFGLQFGDQCYGGSSGYDVHGKADDSNCMFKYGGAAESPFASVECGSAWHNAVYKIN